MYKCMQGRAPVYLTTLCTDCICLGMILALIGCDNQNTDIYVRSSSILYIWPGSLEHSVLWAMLHVHLTWQFQTFTVYHLGSGLTVRLSSVSPLVLLWRLLPPARHRVLEACCYGDVSVCLWRWCIVPRRLSRSCYLHEIVAHSF